MSFKKGVSLDYEINIEITAKLALKWNHIYDTENKMVNKH